MRIENPSLVLTFPGKEPVTTTSIVLDSISINEQLYNELAPSSNSVSLRIKPDDTDLIEDIIKENEAVKAVLKNGNNPLFTGYISNNYSWQVAQTGEDVLQINLEDTGTRLLQKPYASEDDTFVKDTFQNIVATIRSKCNNQFLVVYDSNVGSDIKQKELLNKINSQKTCEEILKETCYELGLIYYFNNEGNLAIKKTDLVANPSTTVASKGSYPHYLYVEGTTAITLTKKAKQYSQVRVKYNTIEDSTTPVIIHNLTENINVPGGQWWDGALHEESIYELTLDEFFQSGKTYYVKSGSTYVQATVTIGDPIPDDTYYEYANVASTVEAVDLEKGKDILYIYPNTVIPNLENQNTAYSSGGVDYVAAPTHSPWTSRWTLKQHNNTSKLDTLIDNTNSSLSAIYTAFRADARIIRKTGTASIYRAFKDLTANPDIQYNYEAEWIHNADDVRNLAILLNNYYGYCNNTYTFYTEDDLALGDVVTINENLWSGLNIKVLLVARSYVCYGLHNGLFKYTAQAISDFDKEPIIRNVSNSESSATQGPPGPPGPPGEGVIDIEYQYATSATQDGQKTQWQDTVPELDADTHKYLWIKTTLIFSDKPSEDIISIGAVYGDEGTATTIQYALKLQGVEPVDADFSDERDTGWYAGYAYWYRFKYETDSGTTYSEPALDGNMNDIMNSLVSFNIESSTYSYIKNLRTNNSQSITFTATSNKYESPVYSWVINGTQYSGTSVTINFTDNTAPDQFNVSCSLTSATNVSAGPLTLVIKANDTTVLYNNFGVLSSNPTGLAIEGDYYIKQVGNDYLPYVYTNGQWTQIQDVSAYPEQMSGIRDIIIANGTNIPVTSTAIYAYFKNISAQHANIDTISSSEITLTNTGVIKSTNYSEDAYGNPTDGFKISADGTANFVNSNVVDSYVSGSFTSNPLETQTETAGSTITGVFGSTQYYNDGYVYDRIANQISSETLQSIQGTYGSSSFSNILLLTDDSQRNATRLLYENTNVTGSASHNSTIPVSSDNVTFSGTNVVRSLNLWRGLETRTSTMSYKIGSGSWTTFTGQVSGLHANASDGVSISHSINTSDYTYGTYNGWTSGNILPPNGVATVSSSRGLNSLILEANNGNLVCLGRQCYIYYSSDRGQSWNSVHLNSFSSSSELAYGAFLKGNNSIIVAINSNTANGGIFRSTDNGVTWSQVASPTGPLGVNLSYIGGAAYGNGEFRLTLHTTTTGYFKSTDDGATWSWVSDSNYNCEIVFNGSSFISVLDNSSLSGTDRTRVHLSYEGGNLIMPLFSASGTGSAYNYGKIYYNQGDGWYYTQLFDEPAKIGYCTPVRYVNGYYYIIVLTSSGVYPQYDGIWYSSNLTSWSLLSNFKPKSANIDQFSYTKGRLVFRDSSGVSNYLDRYLDFGRYPYSSFNLDSVGSMRMTYDYSSYYVGANLTLRGNMVALIQNDPNSWRTTKTTIPSLQIDPTAYIKFDHFENASHQTVNSFDARDYVDQSNFIIDFETFDGTDVYIDSPTSGNYTYNLKWNGVSFAIYLGGEQVGAFDLSDYFATHSEIEFTPVSQTDAILVKDVLPKTDSAYVLGQAGNRFQSAHINNVNAVNLFGDWDVLRINSNTTLGEMAVGKMRPILVRNSNTISLTMPGDSSQQYVVVALNVIVAALVSAGKNPQYNVVNGGASLNITWTSSAEPNILIFVIRIN